MRLPIPLSLLTAVLAVTVTGCGPDSGTSDLAAGGVPTGHTTTEFFLEPNEFFASEMPMSNPVEIPVLVGMNVDEAIAEAERRGWVDVQVHRLDSREAFYQQTSSPMIRIVLDVRDEIVVQAVAG